MKIIIQMAVRCVSMNTAFCGFQESQEHPPFDCTIIVDAYKVKSHAYLNYEQFVFVCLLFGQVYLVCSEPFI